MKNVDFFSGVNWTCSIYLQAIRASCSSTYQWNCDFSLCGHTAFPLRRRRWCPLYRNSNLSSVSFFYLEWMYAAAVWCFLRNIVSVWNPECCSETQNPVPGWCTLHPPVRHSWDTGEIGALLFSEWFLPRSTSILLFLFACWK